MIFLGEHPYTRYSTFWQLRPYAREGKSEQEICTCALALSILPYVQLVLSTSEFLKAYLRMYIQYIVRTKDNLKALLCLSFISF